MRGVGSYKSSWLGFSSLRDALIFDFVDGLKAVIPDRVRILRDAEADRPVFLGNSIKWAAFK
jgi:hypothetical protein